MSSIVVEVSGTAELEREIAIANLSSDLVQFRVTRLDAICEAGPLLLRLQEVCRGQAGWQIQRESSSALLNASKIYESLDLLELRLGVLRLEVEDVEDGIAVRRLRGEMLTKEQPGSVTSELVDQMAVEVDEVERSAAMLGFSGSLAEDGGVKGEVCLASSQAMKVEMVSKIQRLCLALQKAKRGQFVLLI